ncbi:hypothetical protein DFH06DRAFT_1137496 [Mycena polygramma]|nr:hypothetical protein DFH06DRAFT_1137496 [Mycena polygramma]
MVTGGCVCVARRSDFLEFSLLDSLRSGSVGTVRSSKNLNVAIVETSNTVAIAVDSEKDPADSNCWRIRCPLDILPLEVVWLVAELLAYCDDGSPLAVVQAANNTLSFSQTCRCVRGACLSFGPTWANINLSLSSWRPRVRPPFLCEFIERLQRCRNAPIRICFNVLLHLRRGGDYIGDRVWAELLRFRDQWSVLHLVGPPSCQTPDVCAKAVALSALLSRHGPRLRNVSLLSTDRVYNCQSSHAGPVVVDLGGLWRLTTCIPFTILHPIDEPPSAGTLVYLDVENQLGSVVYDVFRHTPNLETLVWRANEAVVQGPPVALPKLLQLFVYSLRVAPPVVADNLVEMVVEDSNYYMDAAMFSSLVGGYGTVVKLRYLDLMGTRGIPNGDLLAIFRRCSYLHRFAFPSSPGSYARTDLYREVGDQVISGYVLNSRYRLRSIKCHGLPTRQPGIGLYEFLLRMGILGPDSRIEFHFDIWRVRCGPCTGRFDVRNTLFFEEFKRENGFTSDLVLAAMYEKYLNPGKDAPSPFTLLLVFSSVAAAVNCLEKGVTFRSQSCSWVKELEG